jgi:DNA-binding GntR family transcriptional regulator
MNFTIDDPASAEALLKRSAGTAVETSAGPAPAGNIKNTKASLLVNRLREAILSGELAPGTKINLDVVRRRLDVSLSPLREALARLIAVGLVELHDNRGYTVAPVSLSNLAEITKLRVEFESLALSSAITRGDLAWESDVMRALHRLNRTERIAGEPTTLEAWEHAHRDFHMVLIAGCGMPLLLNSCVMLHNLNDRYRRIFLIAQGGDRNVAAEHSEIAQGAVARDTGYACAKLREHILRTGTNLHARLASQLQP